MIYDSLSDVTPRCYWGTIHDYQEQDYHDGLKTREKILKTREKHLIKEGARQSYTTTLSRMPMPR